MAELWNTIYSWVAFMPQMLTRTNIIEIIILAFLLYEILLWIKNTRAWTLLRGICVILGFVFVAWVLNLYTILWIMERLAYVAAVALVIIFQPELRRALEQLGSTNPIMGFFSSDNNKSKEDTFNEKTISELVRAAVEMGKEKMGALMVIEREVSLSDIERTGIEVDGLVTSQLLLNIFEHNTPLHDGAVVIRGDRVAAATCYLPLSDNPDISKDLGTRHRAAVGISEVTDSVTIVVSEETGDISLAENGELTKINDAESLSQALTMHSGKEDTGKRFKIWKGRLKR